MCDQQQWDASSHEELLFACFFTIFYTSSLTTFDISAQFQLSMIWTACLLSLQFVSSLSFVLPLYFLFQLTYLLPFRASFSGFREISLACKKKSHTESRSRHRVITLAVLHADCCWRKERSCIIVCGVAPVEPESFEPPSRSQACEFASPIIFDFVSFFSGVLCGLNFVRDANGSPMLGGCGGEFY